MSKEDYKLCYVDGNKAWFTSDFENQWGDDWNDAPYECNAEAPYDCWYEETKEGLKPHKIELATLYLDFSRIDVKLPCDGYNYHSSPFSVEDINKKAIAWIRGDKFNILAETTYSDFIKIVQENGGTIYEPIEKIK